MNEHRAPFNFTAMGREYLAIADTIHKKVKQLKSEFKCTGNDFLLIRIGHWEEIERDLRHQAIDFLLRGERRKQSG